MTHANLSVLSKEEHAAAITAESKIHALRGTSALLVLTLSRHTDSILLNMQNTQIAYNDACSTG